MSNTRKAYMAHYRPEYKKRVRIVKVTAPNALYSELERVAEREGLRPATFAKQLIATGLEGETRVPAEVSDELVRLRHLVRSVANNMNQLAKHSNQVREVIDHHAVFDELKKLERHIIDYTLGRLKETHADPLDVG